MALCTFRGNFAHSVGGAICATGHPGDGLSLIVVGSTFDSNRANVRGGPIPSCVSTP